MKYVFGLELDLGGPAGFLALRAEVDSRSTGDGQPVLGILVVHGWFYVVYLFACFRLWSLMRWPFGGSCCIASAASCRFLSFFLEVRIAPRRAHLPRARARHRELHVARVRSTPSREPAGPIPTENPAVTEQTETDQRPVLVVDFGAQYAQLIARRVREAGVYSEIVPHTDHRRRDRARRTPSASCSRGGPSSVYEPGAPALDAGILDLGVPTLGICYGFQVMAQAARRRGRATPACASTARRMPRSPATAACCSPASPTAQNVWMSHGDSGVAARPRASTCSPRRRPRRSRRSRSDERGIYGVQWHPEVKHSEYGQRVIENFLHRAAGIPADWNSGNVIAEQVARIREQVGSARVICGALGRRRLGGRRRARARGRRRPARRASSSTTDCCARASASRSSRTTSPRPACGSSPIDAARAVPRRARRRQRPRAEAQDHRPRVHPLVRGGRARPRRRGGRRRRADPLPRAGHAVPRRRRVRRRHRHREHQEPPQRRRPARRPAVRARRAAAHALQGRGARHRPRARPARGDRRPAAVSGARPRHPHRRRGHR